jgi:hypothetical protein
MNQNQTMSDFLYMYIESRHLFRLTKPHIEVLFMILCWKNKTEWTYTSLVLY